MTTGFGFFTPEALASQTGLSSTPQHRSLFEQPGTPKELPPSPQEKLQMLTRLTGYWPTGGAKGLGQIRAERHIHPKDWYFKAHFYEDPVQPGSLGLEAFLQLLRVFMVQKNLTSPFEQPHFEALCLGTEHTWKYRGQVLPHHQIVVIQVEALSIEQHSGRIEVQAVGSLWVDGVCIYEVNPMGMAVREATIQASSEK